MYTVYKITNVVNNKFYIGVHKTENPNDSYMGSGKAIKNAILKYGKSSFKKELLLLTKNKEEAYRYERKLTEDFISKDNYNMKLGGVGGFTKENSKKGYEASLKKLTTEQLSEIGKRGNLISRQNGLDVVENGRKGGLANKGKPKSEEHKQKLRDTWIKKKLDASSSIGRTFCS